jgi:hypothetical protein
MTLLARFSCHTQQVCGIAWSKEGEYLATGGNDNQLYLFDSRRLFARAAPGHPSPPSDVTVHNASTTGDPTRGQGDVLSILPGHQKHLFTLNAAVKAVSFAPWQASLLATGGGSNDRCIHFFHALSGATLATIDCHAQVTSLVWSEKRREIAATFGFTQPEHPYRVAVFSWPSCRRVVGIPWFGEERALYAVGYPGGPGAAAVHALPGETRAAREARESFGARTRAEGSLVVATSDASIKFHEIWARREGGRPRSPEKGVFGGSRILQDDVGLEDACIIR